MVREIPEELQKLKQQYSPDNPINVVDQMRIIAEAVTFRGCFEEDHWGLANYLGVSESKVRQMDRAYTSLIPEMKEWLSRTDYQGNMAYKLSMLSVEDQLLHISDTKVISQDE